METENQSSQAMSFLRWIAIFPGAVMTAWLAWFAAVLLNRITMTMSGLDPNSFLPKVFIEFISHAVMGAAFVYIGTKIAPLKNKKVAYILTGIGLLSAGFMLFPAIRVANYWSIWSGVALIIGFSITAYSVFIGETDLPNNRSNQNWKFRCTSASCGYKGKSCFPLNIKSIAKIIGAVLISFISHPFYIKQPRKSKG